MKFIIKCETFARLSQVCAFFDPYITEEMKAELSHIRLEFFKGKMFAIACNQKIAAIEHLGATTDSDGYADVILSSQLIDQCRTEAPFDGMLEIETFPEFAIATAKTTFGYVHKENACSFIADNVLQEWPTWVPKKQAKASKGAMRFNLNNLQTLAQSSPSGLVVLPEFVDIDEPVVMRDIMTPNWVGIFMAKPSPLDPTYVPATVPDWWKK